MDKYPVLEGKQAAGELTVSGESLYTVFDVSCAKREGLWCAWAVGETGSLRIGVLEPEGDRLHITRRFSQRLTAPLGVLLRGEDMFCFAQPRRVKNRDVWVFRFNSREWPVF